MLNVGTYVEVSLWFEYPVSRQIAQHVTGIQSSSPYYSINGRKNFLAADAVGLTTCVSFVC